MNKMLMICVILFLSFDSANTFALDISEGKSDAKYILSIAPERSGMFQDNYLLVSEIETGREQYTRNESGPTYKSEGTAVLLAIFPGIFIHGSGHIYAGDYLTGSILLGLEVISSHFLVQVAAAKAFGTNNETLVDIVGGISLVTFIGGWIYDIVFADAAVRRHNNKIRAGITFPSDQCTVAMVSIGFSF